MNKLHPKKKIVISAVNLVEGGTLTILRDCLQYLSENLSAQFDIIAIVNDKKLAYFENIHYIEDKWPKKRWMNRLWFEYVSLKKISKNIGPVYFWFSLHDTTPNVIAESQAVYCHSPFIFYKAKFKELFLTPKIFIFSLFTRYIYKTNIQKNTFVVVQQQWIKEEMVKIFHLARKKVVIARPTKPTITILNHAHNASPTCYQFIFPSSPNSHKNFEVICEAAKLVEQQLGEGKFKVLITIKGAENKYAEWLYQNWGNTKAIQFIGFQNKESLFHLYEVADCLVFPSKVETWGLPISEFSGYNKPMLLADLPYAHETAAGAERVSFFNPNEAAELAEKMKKLIEGDTSFLEKIPEFSIEEPVAYDWDGLFKILLPCFDYAQQDS